VISGPLSVAILQNHHGVNGLVAKERIAMAKEAWLSQFRTKSAQNRTGGEFNHKERKERKKGGFHRMGADGGVKNFTAEARRFWRTDFLGTGGKGITKKKNLRAVATLRLAPVLFWYRGRTAS
jgi:hypothetical protein